MIRHNVLVALQEAQEASEAAGRRQLTPRDGAFLGARVALDNALVSVNKLRFLTYTGHDKHITRLVLNRVLKSLGELKMSLENEAS